MSPGVTTTRCGAVLSAVASIVGPAGCVSPSDEGDQGLVVRVAAAFGFDSLTPSAHPAGSAAGALDLVYAPFDDYATISAREPAALVLDVRRSSSLSARELAAKIRFEGVDEVIAETESRLRVRFANEEAMQGFERVGLAVDDGPFFVEDEHARPLRLRRRRPGNVDVIEIHDVTSDDQWRRLLGRRLDVIPFAEERSRPELDDVHTVRVLDIDLGVALALYFNTRSGPFADVQQRRRIARAIDREALSMVVCGSERCRTRTTPPPDPGEGRLPEWIDLAVGEGHQEALLAAEVIRHQLRECGVDVGIRRIKYEQVLVSETLETFIGIWASRSRAYQTLVSPRPSHRTPTGYANPDYDRAVAAGDLDAAQAILDRDVPMTPLYEVRLFAVVDDRFCGDVEPDATSWLWIADLRPCEPGEVP